MNRKLAFSMLAVGIIGLLTLATVKAVTTFSWSGVAGTGALTYTGLGIVPNISLDTAASVTLTADADADTGCQGNIHFNNDADAITYVLPAVSKGLVVTIGATDLGEDDVIKIEVDDADKIVLDGALLDAGDTIDGPAATGASITLIGLDGVRWNTVNRTGTWTDGGATQVVMAGTVTLTKTGIGSIGRWSLGWTSDGSGDADTTFIANGVIRRTVFNPGSPAPTDNYDVVINDADGFDVLAGQGANRDTATNEHGIPGVAFTDGVTTSVGAVYVAGQLSLAVSNAGSAKAGEVILYLET